MGSENIAERRANEGPTPFLQWKSNKKIVTDNRKFWKTINFLLSDKIIFKAKMKFSEKISDTVLFYVSRNLE